MPLGNPTNFSESVSPFFCVCRIVRHGALEATQAHTKCSIPVHGQPSQYIFRFPWAGRVTASDPKAKEGKMKRDLLRAVQRWRGKKAG